MKPRFATGGQQVVGYSVAFRGKGEPWFSGTRLGRDLKLPAVRAAGNWPELDAATVAVAWNNPRARFRCRPALNCWPGPSTGSRSSGRSSPTVDPTDQVTWAHAARDAAAILNTWSLRVEPTPGPIAQAGYTLRASATIQRATGDRRRWLLAGASRDACNALLGYRPARTSRELINQVSAIVQQITETHLRSLQEQRAIELKIAALDAIKTLQQLDTGGLAPADARPLNPAFEVATRLER